MPTSSDISSVSNVFEYLAEGNLKAENPNQIYSMDTYPVAVCDNIRISRARPYQGQMWQGKIANSDASMV